MHMKLVYFKTRVLRYALARVFVNSVIGPRAVRALLQITTNILRCNQATIHTATLHVIGVFSRSTGRGSPERAGVSLACSPVYSQIC